MYELRDKYLDYTKIINYTFKYEFESGNCLEYKFSKNSFPHLIGLHKLTDLPIIQRFNDKNDSMVSAKYLISKIKQEKLTEEDLKSSVHFEKIVDRYQFFSSENLFSMTYTDVIIDFDVSLLKKSRLVNTQYILYEEENEGYRQLCVAQNPSTLQYYAETFFYEPSNDYIKGQVHEKIRRMQIIAPDSTVYLEDEF